MKRNKNKMKGFTLVELLAVIVILAIILVIAVPKVMTVIEDSKKATLESTAKMIASAAEKAKVQNTVLGKDEKITCKSVAKINDIDYKDCSIDFDDNTAKVTIAGSGKFAGLYVCNGTKVKAEAINKACPTPFESDDWGTIVAKVKSGNYPYKVGDTKKIEMDVNGDNTLEQYTIRVANTTKCSELEEEPLSKSACGFVLEFADIITNHEMNEEKTNVGGWPASVMRKYLNDLDEEDDEDGVIYYALPEELREGIIETTVISGHGSTEGEENFTSKDYLYLLSEYEVYGSKVGDWDTSATYTITRQLDYYATYKGNGYVGVIYFRHAGVIKKNGSGKASGWWLRTAQFGSVSYFCYVSFDGYLGAITSSSKDKGVSPAFRLAN